MNRTPYIILLNGPPGCGKDTAAGGLEEHLNKRAWLVQHLKMADPLKKAAASFVCESPKYFEYDKGGTIVGRLSKREFLIYLSETTIKPILGRDWLGLMAVKRMTEYCKLFDAIDRDVPRVFVFSDTGFEDEVHPILTEFDSKRVMLMRINRTGCDFKGDSRSYLKNLPIRTVDIPNIDKDEFVRKVCTKVITFVAEEEGYEDDK
jgi:hypothetical protein